ncbi:high mobility group B protein 7-like [Rutidosis leptorrhynchoides]|uniref:high mobility group B protein 7-like n=1 Tax=Rutidosis leptorrhynchoides TaxID=125765 RepID=UPI003A99FE1F
MAAGRSSTSNPPKSRKRVEAESSTSATATATAASLLRAKDGSAFAKCDECNKSVPVALISMHSCSLDAKIKMNLEAQVVEMPSEVNKPAERKRSASSQPRSKKAKTETSKKGKRPPTAFFTFMDDFRKEYKEAHPDAKGVKEVAKEGGEKWRKMSDEEKQKYKDKAAALKAMYEEALENNDDQIDDDEGASEKELEDASEKEDVADQKLEDSNEKGDSADKELEDF